MNEPKYLDFLTKDLIDKIRRIEMYSPGGPIEASQGRPSTELFYEQRAINQEIQEEKSERERAQNKRGINSEINV